MTWQVEFSRRAAKQLKKLPQNIQEIVALLISEIEQEGPIRGNWPNFSKLEKGIYHCHLKKGRPTYVMVWAKKGKILNLYSCKRTESEIFNIFENFFAIDFVIFRDPFS